MQILNLNGESNPQRIPKAGTPKYKGIEEFYRPFYPLETLLNGGISAMEIDLVNNFWDT